MARMIGRLSAIGLNGKPKGMHPDGGGLYLHVNAAGARSWILRFVVDGRARDGAWPARAGAAEGGA